MYFFDNFSPVYLPGQFTGKTESLFSLLCYHFNPQARLSLSHTSSVFVWCPSGHSHWSCGIKATMLPQRMKKAVTDNPKKLANLIDLVNLPSTLRDFLGQSQISRLGCFMRVWSYIKTNNLQVPFKKTFFFIFLLYSSSILYCWEFGFSRAFTILWNSYQSYCNDRLIWI